MANSESQPPIHYPQGLPNWAKTAFQDDGNLNSRALEIFELKARFRNQFRPGLQRAKLALHLEKPVTSRDMAREWFFEASEAIEQHKIQNPKDTDERAIKVILQRPEFDINSTDPNYIEARELTRATLAQISKNLQKGLFVSTGIDLQNSFNYARSRDNNGSPQDENDGFFQQYLRNHINPVVVAGLENYFQANTPERFLEALYDLTDYHSVSLRRSTIAQAFHIENSPLSTIAANNLVHDLSEKSITTAKGDGMMLA